MNKILNVNLGGYALTIDDDAFEYLQNYLMSIKRRFSASEGRDEILSDIEARLGELIQQKLGARSIAMLPDVQAAVEIMGKPEDFGGEEEHTSRAAGASSGGRSIRTGKRFFRDEEDSVVGGVCSGLSAYLGITDPLWMRLIFVLLTLVSAGFWIPAYILMMILVPPAKTAAERLAMRGETINVDNIAREVEEGFDRFSSKMNDFGEGVKKKNDNSGNHARNAIASGVTIIGSIFGGVLRGMGKLSKWFALFLAIAIIAGLGISWIAGSWSFLAFAPVVDYFSPFSKTGTYLAASNILVLLIGLPVLALILWVIRVLFKVSVPRWFTLGSSLLWVFSLLMAILTGGGIIKSLKNSATFSSNIDVSAMTGDTLVLAYSPTDFSGWESLGWFEDEDFENSQFILYNDQGMQIRNLVNLRIKKSAIAEYVVTKNLTGRGANTELARKNAEIVQFEPKFSGNTLLVPGGMIIPKGEKMRVGRVNITIEIPEGKFIKFAKGINGDVESADFAKANGKNRIYRNPDKIYKMTSTGLLCVDCEGNSNFDSDESFKNYHIDGEFEVEIVESEDFALSMSGITNPESSVQTIKTENDITLNQVSGKDTKGLKIRIETDDLDNVFVSNGAKVVIRGFDFSELNLTAENKAEVKTQFSCNLFTARLRGNSKLTMQGTGTETNVILDEASTLDAFGYKTQNVDIKANNGSKARIYVEQEAKTNADASSEIKVDGNATEKAKEDE